MKISKKLVFKYVLVSFLLLWASVASAFSADITEISSLAELQDVLLSDINGTVLFVVDQSLNAGIANQNPYGDPVYLYTNGGTGWNNTCANYANLALVPAENCSGANVVLPAIEDGFHIRVYDTSLSACYSSWDDPDTDCAGQTYVDITYLAPVDPGSDTATTTLEVAEAVVFSSGFFLFNVCFWGLIFYFKRNKIQN